MLIKCLEEIFIIYLTPCIPLSLRGWERESGKSWKRGFAPLRRPLCLYLPYPDLSHLGRGLIWIPAFAGMTVLLLSAYLGKGTAVALFTLGQVVALRFPGNGLLDEFFKIFRRGAAAQGLPEVYFLFAE